MALANSVFPYAFTVSTTVVATRVYAGILELHVTNVALALVRRHALAVIACLAARHASATISVGSISRFIFIEGDTEIRNFNIHERETVVALANLGCNACAVAACRADRHAPASFRIPVIVDACANLRRRAGAVATFDAADRLTSERQVNIVVLHHAITLLADTRIGSYALSIPLAGWMANWIAHVRGAR
jgi:hypothetical protein